MSTLDKFLTRLRQKSAILVSVYSTRGSVPREPGAWMAIFADEAIGTIGGGNLELQAMAEARSRLVAQLNPDMQPDIGPDLHLGAGPLASVLRYGLGPSLGQCCGGEVYLRYEYVQAADATELRTRLTMVFQPVALFGGGHVGRALVNVLGTLPIRLSWIDSRHEIFPSDLPFNVVCEHSDPVQGGVAGLEAGSLVLIMSFSHSEDMDVVGACLIRQRQQGDLPYIGLIGSKTKWATFRSRLRARGFTDDELNHVTCPIGLEGIKGKEPEVIAVGVAAQILLVSSKT